MAPKKSGKSSKALDKKSMKKVKGGAVDAFNVQFGGGGGAGRTSITDGTSNTITGGTLNNKVVSP